MKADAAVVAADVKQTGKGDINTCTDANTVRSDANGVESDGNGVESYLGSSSHEALADLIPQIQQEQQAVQNAQAGAPGYTSGYTSADGNAAIARINDALDGWNEGSTDALAKAKKVREEAQAIADSAMTSAGRS